MHWAVKSQRAIFMDVQGGKREAAAYARKHLVSQATLEMLADMRWQFASMLADARFVVPPKGYSGAGSRHRAWTDDAKQPWNKQAHQPSLVSDSWTPAQAWQGYTLW